MMSEMQQEIHQKIQWYPGHIAKVRRQLEERIKLLDVLLVVLDARLPGTTFNPDVLNSLLQKEKPVLWLFNKADLADPKITDRWIQDFETHYIHQNSLAMAYSAKQPKNSKHIIHALEKLGESCWQKLEKKGLKRRPLRVGVIGMPNVGKSTVINSLFGKKRVATGDKAGVTRGLSWLKLNNKFELMDSPGLIPPKLDNQDMAIRLAAVFSIGEQAFDIIEVAEAILNLLSERYPGHLEGYYQLPALVPVSLKAISEIRQMKLSETEWNLRRAAESVLKALRNGDFGPLSFEEP